MTTLNNSTTKKTINISELYKKPDIKKAYIDGKDRLGTDDIVDRIIHIKKAEYKREESATNKGELVDYMYLYFTLEDEEKVRYIKTQSLNLREHIKAIPEEYFESSDIVAMIKKQVKGVQKSYSFAGVE